MEVTEKRIERARSQEQPHILSSASALHFHYRFNDKAKLISFCLKSFISVAEARQKRSMVRRHTSNEVDPVEERKTKHLALKFFYLISRKCHTNKSNFWTMAYREKKTRIFEKYIFPFIDNSHTSNINPLKLLVLLLRVKNRGALEKTRKLRKCCGDVFCYAIITGRAEYNSVPDLVLALAAPKPKSHPYLSAEELHHYVRVLEAYTGSSINKNATKIIMLPRVKAQEMRFATWDEVDLKKGIREIPVGRIKMRIPHNVLPTIQEIDIFKQKKSIISHYSYILLVVLTVANGYLKKLSLKKFSYFYINGGLQATILEIRTQQSHIRRNLIVLALKSSQHMLIRIIFTTLTITPNNFLK